MENLFPPEIALDIFSRLPAESVLRCRLVCKTWRTLLNDTNFADIHLRRQLLQLDDAPKFHNHLDVVAGAKVGFIFLIEIDDEGQLVYGEYDENDEQSYKTLTRINHPPIEAIIHDWVDSCNGLFCLSVDHHGFQDPVYICNPITRECTNLPKFMDFKVGKSRFDYDDYLRDKNGIMVSGFGCNLSMNEYKVVRIYYADYRYRDNRVGCVQVYTLGGGGSGWRSKGEISYKFLDRQGVFINGALHWLEGTGKIVAFDLADEKFRVLPAPPFLDDKM
ncbi:F-box domain [Macleaya cordata]|uniref:F-box domain n=1 Tax=Macleaya cordata TaxID=56857 RepID=A0A200RAN4_MACCD|nr:F-box domain [Macleaya cordata]